MKYSLRSLMIVLAVAPPFVALFLWLRNHNPGFAWLAAAAAFWLAAINYHMGSPMKFSIRDLLPVIVAAEYLMPKI